LSVEVESAEEIRRGILKELKEMANDCLIRVAQLIHDEKWEQAIGALGTIEYVLRYARDWNEKEALAL